VVPTTIERRIDCVTPQRILFCSHPKGFFFFFFFFFFLFFIFWVFSKADFFTTDD
tara:strand:+ start:1316 stop:1480 length:165 start_codon:yes stop_codon:yes gene_type:complete